MELKGYSVRMCVRVRERERESGRASDEEDLRVHTIDPITSNKNSERVYVVLIVFRKVEMMTKCLTSMDNCTC